MKTKKILSEPILHFFALGLLLFAVYAAVNDDSSRSAEEIVISQARLSSLDSIFEKTWRRPPNEEESQDLIDAWVREEVLYREGIAIGFDLDDPIIRRRVAQKMSFVAGGLVPRSPEDTVLEAWLIANIEDYEIPASFTLQQVFIDPERHFDDVEVFTSSIYTALNDGVDAYSLGDSSLLPAALELSSSVQLARVFGKGFAGALTEMTVGDWQGPVRSEFGLHFVKIFQHIDARQPDLEEVRAAVERDVLSDSSRKINEAFYTELRKRYTVRIESPEQDD